MQYRICTICGINKPYSEFHKSKSHATGVRAQCKECRSKKRKAITAKKLEEKKKLDAQVTHRVCTKCGKLLPLESFYKKEGGKYGRRADCIKCKNEGGRKYYNENIEKVKEKQRAYAEAHKEEKREYDRMYRKNNKDKKAAWQANRNAMKRALIHEEGSSLWLDILEKYDNKCAVTGKKNPQLEHMVALSTGHCGTYEGNIYPMTKKLNMDKSNKNPFKWMKRLKGKEREAFNQVLHRLAELNGMTYSEYRKFVYWCYNNPRTLEQVRIDNEKGLTSIDLFRLSQQSNT